ncbi:hypothetical protein CC79DRAFT_1365801 [Sarocladium strictum]
MEALGGVASVIAVIDISIKSASGVQALVSAIKDGPQTIALLGRDVMSLFVVLSQLSRSKLEKASDPTLVQLKAYVDSCDEELATIQTLLIELQSKSSGLSDRARAGIRVVRKGKDLGQAQQSVRDLTTQLNLYLALVQAEITETTGQGLDQILETLQKVHDCLDSLEPPVAKEKDPLVLEEDAAGSRKTQQECEELQESTSRLSELVGHDGAVLSDEDAGHIIDDLQRLIQSAKDHAGSNDHSSTSKETRDELRLVESMIIAAPSLSINHQGPRKPKEPESAPEAAHFRQKRLRQEIDIGCGVLTIATKKRRRLDQGGSAASKRTRGGAGRDVVASFSFRPTNNAFTFRVSVTQGELFNYCLQSIPEMCFNPTMPSDSRVFRVVKEGRIDEFRAMLRDGETSTRVHDEKGRSLLYYALDRPEICKLLLEANADPDEIINSTDPYTVPILAATRQIYATTRLLLEYGADPSLSVTGWLGLQSQIAFGGPCLRDEINDLSSGFPVLHGACYAWPDSHCCPDTLALLLKAGADPHVRISGQHPGVFRNNNGFTALHSLVEVAHFPSTKDEIESLIYLIQQGCSIRAVCDRGRSVSRVAYSANIVEREDGHWSECIGGYRGDLWDAALATCGYDLLGFREDFPRVPWYDQNYQRADFERLWEGIEHLCPYWDDCRWPETGGDSDHFNRHGYPDDDSDLSGLSDMSNGSENEMDDEDADSHSVGGIGVRGATGDGDSGSIAEQEAAEILASVHLADLVGSGLGPPLTFESAIESTLPVSCSDKQPWPWPPPSPSEASMRWDAMDVDNPWLSDQGSGG